MLQDFGFLQVHGHGLDDTIERIPRGNALAGRSEASVGSWNLEPLVRPAYSGADSRSVIRGEPHGMLLTTYLNDVAMQALTSAPSRMAPGAIIVKEN